MPYVSRTVRTLDESDLSWGSPTSFTTLSFTCNSPFLLFDSMLLNDPLWMLCSEFKLIRSNESFSLSWLCTSKWTTSGSWSDPSMLSTSVDTLLFTSFFLWDVRCFLYVFLFCSSLMANFPSYTGHKTRITLTRMIYNSPPKGRWIVVDIPRRCSQTMRGIVVLVFTKSVR